MSDLTREDVERIVKEARDKGRIPNLSAVNLSGVDLRRVDFGRVPSDKAKSYDLYVKGADLRGVDFSGADLREANLKRTNLAGADLTRATLFEADLCEADLCRANLSHAIVYAAYLLGANLNGANLYRANFNEASLKRTNLSEAYLNSAILRNADLSGANLAGADLCKAQLMWANLSGANLNGANLSEVVLGNTIFGNVNLGAAKNLLRVKHNGPSEIGVHTLQLSNGQIPEKFLRGCGVSDVQIEMAKLYKPDLSSEQIAAITYKIRGLLVEGAVHYYSCFISYSSQDEAFARRLHDNLQNNGVRCWFAPEDMKIGDKIRPTIDQSIRIHDKLLIILSENSLNSAWVESEVEKAFEEERKRKQTVLFPVRLDEAVMETEESWATEIRRTRHIGDFSRWKDHDAYQQAFERLLRDLKAEGKGPGS